MSERTEERLVALENRVTEQERTLEELNQVVIEQGVVLERLLERVRALVESATPGEPPGAATERPPHY